MGTGIVNVGDTGALGIVAEGGERGGEEQGKDGLGCGFNLGVGAAKAKKCVDGPGLGSVFHAGIAGVSAIFNRGFHVVEGEEGVIVQAERIVKPIHDEADVAGVGDGDGGVRDGLEAGEFMLEFGNYCLPFIRVVSKGEFVPVFKTALRGGAGVFEIAVREDGGVERSHFTALCRDELGQAGEDAGRVILPGSGVKALVIFHDNHCGTSFQSMMLL